MSIGDKVRATRKAAGISQEEVARRAGVSLNVINRLERGVILDPHYSTLRGIASALGVSVEDLVREPALAGKAEAPKAGPATPEAYFRVPYGPGGRAKAREEAVRFIEEAADRGELRPDDVVVRYTGEAVELHHAGDDPAHPVERVGCDAVLLQLGFSTKLGPLKEWGFELEKGALVVDQVMKTNLDRVWACGDITTFPGKLKLIATGFAESAIAVAQAVHHIRPDMKLQPAYSTNTGVPGGTPGQP